MTVILKKWKKIVISSQTAQLLKQKYNDGYKSVTSKRYSRLAIHGKLCTQDPATDEPASF